jgi:CubicO group peptidase (beta-lactamase class C family)
MPPIPFDAFATSSEDKGRQAESDSCGYAYQGGTCCLFLLSFWEIDARDEKRDAPLLVWIARESEASMAIQGSCDSRFHEVREAFETNFAQRGEVGASVCVTIEGRPVVDLWGGSADGSGTPWQRDTIGVVWSATKGAVALCAHVLASRGHLDLDAPVARYWPAFAHNGKDEILVRWLLDHQAGLPAVRRPLRPGELYDWEAMVNILADEAPFWQPGTRQGYQAGTFGHLVGEVVQRVSGRSLDDFFRDEIAGPLDLDFHLGLAEENEPRVAATIRPDPLPPDETPWRFLATANRDRDSVQSLIIRNTGRLSGDHDSRQAHAAILPSQGGITNARGLAGLYTPLAQGGLHLVNRETLALMQEASSGSAIDAVLLVGMRFSLGFMKSFDNRNGPTGARDSLILSPAAFGHAGMGGSLGFADPSAQLAFGYTMNKQGRGVLINERGQVLVDAVYRSLGCRSSASGFWI